MSKRKTDDFLAEVFYNGAKYMLLELVENPKSVKKIIKTLSKMKTETRDTFIDVTAKEMIKDKIKDGYNKK